MVKNTPFPNNLTNNYNNKYKKCSINNCDKDGDYFLSCNSINKIGLFCKKCRTELKECGLVDSMFEGFAADEPSME